MAKNIIETIRKVASNIVKWAQDNVSEPAIDDETIVELGQTPKELIEEKRKRKEQKQEKNKPTVVVTGNIHWKDVPEDAELILKNDEYFYGGRVVYWEGNEFRDAQEYLDDLVKKVMSDKKIAQEDYDKLEEEKNKQIESKAKEAFDKLKSIGAEFSYETIKSAIQNFYGDTGEFPEDMKDIVITIGGFVQEYGEETEASKKTAEQSINMDDKIKIFPISFVDREGNSHTVFEFPAAGRGWTRRFYFELKEPQDFLTGTVSDISKIGQGFIAVKLDNSNIYVREISKRPYIRKDKTYRLYPNGEEFELLSDHYVFLEDHLWVYINRIETEASKKTAQEDEDVNEGALQYAIELLKEGKPIDEAVNITTEIFFKEESKKTLWKKFCTSLKRAQPFHYVIASKNGNIPDEVLVIEGVKEDGEETVSVYSASLLKRAVDSMLKDNIYITKITSHNKEPGWLKSHLSFKKTAMTVESIQTDYVDKKTRKEILKNGFISKKIAMNKCYVGYPRDKSEMPEVFWSDREPEEKDYPNFAFTEGPFGNEKEAQARIRQMGYGEEPKVGTKKTAVVTKCPGHKNSKGELAEWCIKKHDGGDIISSHKTKDEAVKHLRDIEGHK